MIGVEARRAAVVARYGSVQAVAAPCEREALILAAVTPWRKVIPFGGGTLALDGWFGRADLYGMAPRHVVSAIAGAYPMPVTVTEAAAEHAHWEARNRDLGDLRGPKADVGGGRFLDLATDMRAAMVRDVAEHRISARTLDELRARFALFRARGERDGTDTEAAIARDLDALAAAPPATQPTTLADRVAAALRENPEASDRELARLLGSSHPTISKARQALRRGAQPDAVAP